MTAIQSRPPRNRTDEVNPVIWADVDAIVLPHDRSRKEPDPTAVDRIARSLADVGLLMPIGVTPRNVLIFGSTRLAAAKKLGWRQIEAREFESADDIDRRQIKIGVIGREFVGAAFDDSWTEELGPRLAVEQDRVRLHELGHGVGFELRMMKDVLQRIDAENQNVPPAAFGRFGIAP